MTSKTLHILKEICRVQKEINYLEQDAYSISSKIKTLLESNNHLIDELIMRVQIDCNEADLESEIKESLITQCPSVFGGQAIGGA